jgi:DNA-directed RNA polymerase specialized sigma24 family protein
METVTLEKKQFDELLANMEKIAKLLALNLVKDCKVQKDKILMLSYFGYGPTEIANILNTTVGTVNKDLSRSRKEKIGKETKPEKSMDENSVQGGLKNV